MTPQYNPNIPTKTMPYADWQKNMQANFTALANAFKINHITLDGTLNLGNHTYAQMVQQENPPQTNIDEIAVYAKDLPEQAAQIFIRYPGNGQEVQYTNYQIYSIKDTNTQTSYFTFLPGKLIVYFGFFSGGPGAGTAKKPAPSAIPISLTPPVALNIVSINFTPTSPDGVAKSPVEIIKSGKYITGVLPVATLPSNLGPSQPSCYYTIVANI